MSLVVDGLEAQAGRFTLGPLSFSVPAGGHALVIGPAGAGKTTLVEAIAGVASTARGRIVLDGRAIDALPPERRGVGMMYQHALLFPHLDARTNVAYGSRDGSRVDALMADLGIDALAYRVVESLSGGERQLVSLARALAASPRLLLLDEPFNALDPRRRRLARRVLADVHARERFTIVQVSHDVPRVQQPIDVVLLVESGRITHAAPGSALHDGTASGALHDFLDPGE